MQTFWENVGHALASPQWWAEGLLNWVFFSVLVALLVGLASYIRERLARRPHEHWELQVKGLGGDRLSLHWEEVQRIRTSEFELIKFIKSVVSLYGQLQGRAMIDAATIGWLKIEEAPTKVITVDLNLIPHGMVIWHREEPELWVGKTADNGPNAGPAKVASVL